ncbi:MAG: CotH kinase family protein [Candidatus Cloacimonetes bacterium]|nr:CotH kinase family protein [Candidatus Cloacimonadota bacterium]
MKKILPALSILLVLAINLVGQDFYDINTVNEIRLYFTQPNWDQLLDNLVLAGNEERLLGTAVINGVTYDSVGVRYKGNSSYNPIRIKNPFNIKLDYVHSNQSVGPYSTLRLSNGFKDPSFVREVMGYEIARKYFPASRANYANVFVNNVRIGLYTNVQDVDDYFAEEHYFTGELTRIKGEITSMTPWQIWGYVDENPASYAMHYELDSGDSIMPFINFLNVFNNNPNQMQSVLNVDRHLWYLAFNNLLVNLDSPINNGQNYYVTEDINHRFNPCPWDLNECFGGFTNMQSIGNLNLSQMQTLDALVNSTHPQYPIINKVLANPLYKRMYIAHMRTMLEENLSNNWYSTRAMELQAICGPLLQTDANALYNYQQFLNNLNNTVTGGTGNPQTIVGITQLMNPRVTFLLNSTAFQGTVPSINATNHSPVVVQPDTALTVTAVTSNAAIAVLGWRQNRSLPFQMEQMFDDGLHGDVNAGDGVFGVTINIGVGNIEYYIYAENSQQGRFYPARAEYDYMTIQVTPNLGLLYINEIMAKNASFPDPNGENDDWVEIYNPNDFPVDIGGMYMTDNHYSNGISAWTQIPSTAPGTTTIPPHGYLVVWFDEDLDQGPLHINDKLGGASDAVYLIDTDGTTVLDSFTWTDATGLNTDDISIGRMSDGSTEWQLFGFGQQLPATPGFSNSPVSIEDSFTPAPTIQLKVHPNPMTNRLYIELKHAKEPTKVSIYNLKGQLVQSLEAKSDTQAIWNGCDKSGIPVTNGIYFIKVEGRHYRNTCKVVVLNP